MVAHAEHLRCNISAAVATHFHFDHIGHSGKAAGPPGFALPGMDFFVRDRSLPGFIHQSERGFAEMQIGVPSASLSPLHDGDTLEVGSVVLRVIHTPGHSPGSMTLVVSIDGVDRLALTGDTLFPGSCGRLDLPFSSIAAMHSSLVKLRTCAGTEPRPSEDCSSEVRRSCADRLKALGVGRKKYGGRPGSRPCEPGGSPAAGAASVVRWSS